MEGASTAAADARLCDLYKRIFALRNADPEADPVTQLIRLFHSTASVLLRHEVAYALGQMQQPQALPFLKGLLCDEEEHPIVRHEAAEALGAIGALECRALLRKFTDDPRPEVADTCALALARLDFAARGLVKGPCACEKMPRRLAELEAAAGADPDAPTPEGGAPLTGEGEGEGIGAGAGDEAVADRPDGVGAGSVFLSVDPAPAASGSPSELRRILLDPSRPMFERYGCMFALRNAARGETRSRAVEALCEALEDPSGADSALLKHELAFVLGQLEEPESVPALCRVVRAEAEHPMVRHEAAEALGAVGSPAAMELLQEYASHAEQILRESCVVALHMYDREAFLAAGVVV